MRGEIFFKSSLEEPIAVSKTSSKVGEWLAISAVIFSKSKVLIAMKLFFAIPMVVLFYKALNMLALF